MTPYEKLKREIQERLARYSQSEVLHMYYRGHADHTWRIEPVICRNPEEKQRESSLLAEQMAAGNWDMSRSLFENIAHLQHYGVHTRFLYYTTDADIATYFACAKHPETDTEVIACPYDFRAAGYTDTVLITELAP